MKKIDETRLFAFFSEEFHRLCDGETTVPGFNAETHQIIFANWIGPCVGNFPGLIGQNAIIRPLVFNTYDYIGEIDLNDLRFPTRFKALPANVMKVAAKLGL